MKLEQDPAKDKQKMIGQKIPSVAKDVEAEKKKIQGLNINKSV